MEQQASPFLTVLFSLIGSGVILWTLTLRPATACFFYVVTSFFFPNQGINLMGVGGIAIYHFVRIFQAIALVIVSTRKGREGQGREEYLKRGTEVSLVFCALAIWLFQLAVENLWMLYTHPQAREIPFRDCFSNYTEDLSYLLFWYACCLNLRRPEDFRPILKFIPASVLVLTVEYLLIVKIRLGLIPATIMSRAVDPLGSFVSVFLNDSLGVVLWASAGAIISLYWIIAQRRYVYALPLLGGLYLTLESATRCVILGVVVGMGVFLVQIIANGRRRVGAIVALGLLIAFASTPFLFRSALRSLNDSEKLGVKFTDPGYLVSSYERVGMGMRSSQILAYVFPFGVGPGMDRYYFRVSPPEIWDRNWFEGMRSVFYSGYHHLSVNPSDPPTFFLRFLTSYGLLGWIFLAFLIWHLVNCYRQVFRERAQLGIAEVGFFSFALALISYFTVTGLFYGRAILFIPFFLAVHIVSLSASSLQSDVARYRAR